MEEKRSCLNCGHPLEENLIFCPNCGQKVDANNLKLKVLIAEFIDNYLSLDTRIGRSIFPFLFQPGKLSREFIVGKRRNYVNPFRLYLIISILFFFLLGTLINRDTPEGESALVTSSQDNKSDFLEGFTDGLKGSVDSIRMGLDSAIRANDSLLLGQDTVINLNGIEGLENADITLSRSSDSTALTDSTKKKKSTVSFTTDKSGVNFNFDDLSKIKKYQYDRSYSDEQLLDSLTLESDSLNARWRFVVLQFIRMYRADNKDVMKFILGNYSISMFVLIPSLALLLMLFFRRNRLPFVAHLIHSLQMHSFAFFVYSMAFLAQLLYNGEKTSLRIFLFSSFILSAVYIYFSCKKVYERTHMASFFRVMFLGFLYYFVWAFVLILGLIISFLLY